MIQETVTLDAWEVYCNTALYNDPLLDDIGLIVYLNNISLSQDGDMTFTLYITSDHGVSYGVRTEVTVGEKAPQEVMKSSGTIKPGIWDYANETYTVSNPNMEDVILRVQVITDDNQSREIILPIHFLGDYLTDAPASEIHLPVLNAENTDFEIYDDASFTIDQFSIRLVRAWQEDDGNGIRLIFAVEQPFATPAFIFSGVYSTFEHLPAKKIKNGISYTLHGDYYLPDITLSEDETKPIGRWGCEHKHYLEENRSGLYTRLILSGRLYSTLHELDRQAQERYELIISQMKAAEGITESLKAMN